MWTKARSIYFINVSYGTPKNSFRDFSALSNLKPTKPKPAVEEYRKRFNSRPRYDSAKLQLDQNALSFKQPEDPHLLYTAIIGAPNAGKSTLVNALVGTKVSITSAKAQTTRNEVIGVFTHDNRQIVFLDTPGILSLDEGKRIQRSIVKSAWGTLTSSDVALFVVDVSQVYDLPLKEILPRLKEYHDQLQAEKFNLETALVLNKIDALQDKKVLPEVEAIFNERFNFVETFRISALKKTGTDDLRDFLLYRAQPRPWEFPVEKASDLSDVQKATEIIREKLFRRFNKEIPYVLTQENVGWTEFPDGSLRIDQVIYVPKESQKKIVIGARGSVLLQVSKAAKVDLEKLFGRSVFLYLTVKKKEQ